MASAATAAQRVTNNFVEVFQDRRSQGERRSRRRLAGSFVIECRRGHERRNILRQYHPQPWWLQTNYVEELDPPLLSTPPSPDNADTAQPGPRDDS